MDWFGFWIFMSVVVVADAWLYSQGHDGMFFSHKTDAELAIRNKQAFGGPECTEHPCANCKEVKDDT